MDKINALLKSLSNEEFGQIEENVLMNLMSTTSLILLSSYQDKIEEMIASDKDYSEVVNAIRSEIKNPDTFVQKYVDFIKTPDFSEVFFSFIEDNEYASWNFEFSGDLNKKIKDSGVEDALLVENFLINLILPNIDQLVVKYKLIENKDYIDELVDGYVSSVISININKMIDEE